MGSKQKKAVQRGATYSLASSLIGEKRYRILRFFIFKERVFTRLMIICFALAAVLYPYPSIAMWLGFMFAAYSAIANDSIQTIGTFISSNSRSPWWLLWLYIGLIFLFTMAYGWVVNDGDVSYQRLTSKGFENAPTSFQFLQIAAPLILLLLTRLRMPVSTTFLLLSVFSASASGIGGLLLKSMSGYFVAFTTAIVVWFGLGWVLKKVVFRGKPHPLWRPIQWVVSGMLWAVWLMQDAANIAVFLPRKLSLGEFAFFAGFIFFGLGLLFYLKGDKIQKIVNEKTEIQDVRSATVIDFAYAIILYIFKEMSNIPMSTTWVFIGLLGGRELAMFYSSHFKTKISRTLLFKMIFRDLRAASIGLAISILLAVLINPSISKEILQQFGF
ncbi:MAG: hypothetical protein ACK4NS_06100 [Saprospiraceae bacterium]